MSMNEALTTNAAVSDGGGNVGAHLSWWKSLQVDQPS